MIDATYLKAHRTASNLRVKKGGLGRLMGRTKGGMNTNFHAVADANGRSLSFLMTAGQVNNYIGAAALLDDMPKARCLLNDRGCDADWFKDALQAKGIQPCIPGRQSRNEPVKYDKRRFRRSSRIEIMLRSLEDWRRVATRCYRCPTALFSAVALAATVISWLWSTSPDPKLAGTRRLGSCIRDG